MQTFKLWRKEMRTKNIFHGICAPHIGLDEAKI